MLFNSWEYLLFLPIILMLYYNLPQRYRWVLLFAGSCFFYMYFIPKYILILFLLIAIDYSAALLIDSASGHKRKVFLVLSLAANIGLLAFFKYINMALDSMQEVLGWFHVSKQFTHYEIILPIGLSFHTFQSMAYTIEVYKGNQKPERHLGIYAVYVLFFPQMVAGPIERFETLGNQLKQYHAFKMENLVNGIRLVLFGLFIKMVVADQLSPLVDKVYETPLAYSNESVGIAMLLFSLQIYADFWGYSTIALGSACMMGIQLIDNFKAPYLATSISEFWSKWHISLSTWFRDYVYIPLGGNRGSALKWTFNILVVFGLSGLWHGANWTFLVWGLIHACLYLIAFGFAKLMLPINPKLKSVLGWLFTFVGVTIAWVFFRSHSFEQANVLLHQLLNGKGEALSFEWQLYIALIVFIVLDVLLNGKRFDVFIRSQSLLIRWIVYAVLLFGLTVMAGGEEQPFIYFQF